jgi:uncharacterized protein YggE
VVSKERVNSMTMSGEAKARGAIDIATVTCSVTTKNALGKVARLENNEKMANVFAVLESLKIQKKDYQTVSYLYNDWHEIVYKGRGQNRTSETVLKGKMVVNGIAITLRDLSKLETLLDELPDAGVDDVGNPEFNVSNPGELMDKAREGAIANAMAKAKLYADAMGVWIVAVSSLSERSASYDESNYSGKTMVAFAGMGAGGGGGGGGPSINTGTSQLAVTVNCTFVISDLKRPIAKHNKVANRRLKKSK